MTTRTPIGRATEVPDLAGVRADRAVQLLREHGLLPIMWFAEVDDVGEAGVVLDLDPPAGGLVRPKASVTIGVATHPDFAGHADDSSSEDADRQAEPPSTGPEIRTCSTASRAEPRDELAQPREPDFLPLQLW